jgi:hypothetical protein
MLALLATTGLVLLYLVIGGIGMLVIWASVVTMFMQDNIGTNTTTSNWQF